MFTENTRSLMALDELFVLAIWSMFTSIYKRYVSCCMYISGELEREGELKTNLIPVWPVWCRRPILAL